MIAPSPFKIKPSCPPHPLDLERPLVGTLTIDKVYLDNRDFIIIGHVAGNRVMARVPARCMATFSAVARFLVREGIILDGYDPRWSGPCPATSHGDSWIETIAAAARCGSGDGR